MKARTYIWIEGDGFVPTEFQTKVPSNYSGSIEFRKKVQDGVVRKVREHWKSPKLESCDHQGIVKKLHNMVYQLRPALVGIREEGLMICAEIVIHYEIGNEKHGGVYLPPETVQLLAETGMSIDIDEYFQ